MKLETFFSKKDINNIYDTIIIYSVLKYKKLPEIWQEEFKDRYMFAMQMMKERNLNPNILENIKLEDLKEQLIDYEIIYNI